MSFDDNIKKRYELLEYMDAFTQNDGNVLIKAETFAHQDIDPIMISIWLQDMQQKGLLQILGRSKNDWFTVKVKNPKFHDYVDEVYRWLQMDIKKLSLVNFLAVLDTAYELRLKLEMTQSNKVSIGDSANNKIFPQLSNSSVDFRSNAIHFLKEYGVIDDYDHDGIAFYNVTVTRRFFDRTYQSIITRAVQEGFATYKNDKATTQAIAAESKRREETAKSVDNHPHRLTGSSQKSDQKVKVRFDAKSSTLLFGDKICEIPDETLEHYICKFTFKNRKVAALEDDILEKSVKSQDSKRAVYDAMLRVNKKANKYLGIEKLLVYRAAKLRISKKYQ